MGVKIGNLDISAFKVGSADCAIYLDNVKLYPSEQPSFNGKWLATYTAGTTSSAECDSTSAITKNEINITDLQSVIIGDCVTSIGNRVFSGCTSLTSIDIPNSVTSIGYQAFRYCTSLSSIDIPSGVTSISIGTFTSCSGLTSIGIPSGVTSIGDEAFLGCTSLTSIVIPSGVTSIRDSTFYRCYSLSSIDIPSGVTNIGGSAFRECTSLRSINIPNSVTSIGGYAFSGCTSLPSIIIPDSVTSIGNTAFKDCSSLTSIDIPNSVTIIGNDAFEYCRSLSSCTIGSGVTSIGDSAFYGCSSLTSIDIPSSVTSIYSYAFLGCTSLTGITVNAVTPPTLGNNAFNNTNNCPIYVPSASVSAYKSATNWSTYADRIQEIPSPYQWVTFTNGDTISSDLQIYGIKGIVNDLSSVFDDFSQPIFVENAGRNKYNIIIGGDDVCYSEYDIISNASVEYIFSNIGCSDSYTVSSNTITYLSNDIQLLIYA